MSAHDGGDPWWMVRLFAELLDTDADYLVREAERHSVSPRELTGKFENALAAGAHDPPFDEWAAVPPGKVDLRVFDQDVWWVDVFRRPHRIAHRYDLHDDHLLNVVLYLRAGAQRFHAEYVEFVGRRSEWPSPDYWLAQTKLMIALSTEIDRRELG